MITFLSNMHPVVQAFLATLFTWDMIAVGAASIFLTREINRKLLDVLMGFAAGVMIATSYWSLLAPTIDVGNSMVILMCHLMPYAHSFAAGAMIYVVIEELIQEIQYCENTDAATLMLCSVLLE